MLRKILHITISIILLTVTAGYSISKHYCHNRLVSISISQEAENCCDMEGTNNCCRNETKSFQLNEDFIISPVLENEIVNSIDLFAIFYIVIDNSFKIQLINDFVFKESPPPLKTQTKRSILQTYLC